MKKAIGIAVAIVLFLVLIIVVVLDGGNEDEVCAEDEGGSGSGDVVVDGDFAYPSAWTSAMCATRCDVQGRCSGPRP